MVLQVIARILSAAVSVYMVLCFLRILASWIPGADLGRPGAVLFRLTEPFLRPFRRISWLHLGQFDFSPIAAIALLTVLNSALTSLGLTVNITLGRILGITLQAAWAAVGFVISFLAVLALLRIIVAAARWNSLHPLWMVVDALLNPFLVRINRLIYRGRIVKYLQSLVTGFIVLILLTVAGGGFVGLLVDLLGRLAF